MDLPNLGLAQGYLGTYVHRGSDLGRFPSDLFPLSGLWAPNLSSVIINTTYLAYLLPP